MFTPKCVLAPPDQSLNQLKLVHALQDDYCMMQVDKWHVKVVLITIAYLCYDLTIIFGHLDYNDKLSKQTIAHHIIGIMGSLMTLYYGYGMVVLTHYL
mmetsp:Transcript_17859/g.30316  ORF Transcript_17859/g.30316 Transcript_17859/m.30316 type:complete len:98 (-) Transcript_17859:434-727(-)